jgi:hypothetical protein
MPKFDVEVTDTFSGEANYCWVHRHVIELTPEEASDHKRRRRLIVRRAKAAEGWSGSRCEVSGRWRDDRDPPAQRGAGDVRYLQRRRVTPT